MAIILISFIYETGSLWAALKIYYSRKNKNDSASTRNSLKNRSSKKQSSANGSIVGGSSNKTSLTRPNTLKYDKTISSSRSSKSSLSKKDRLVLNSIMNDDVNNLPAEELLELGLLIFLRF
jgi:hypothetical protein